MLKSAALHFADTFAHLRDGAVLALAATTTIGYGTLFYSYGVVAPRISKEFGIGLDIFFGVFTAGLLLGGLIAPLVGRLIDRYGARIVLAIGSIFAAAALLICAVAPNIWVFGLGVLVMECAACAVFYEAAFAGLTQIFRYEARPRITAITLVAGFASTIFWPLTQGLVEAVDWRWTFAIFAGAHLLICLPLHWFAMVRAKPLTINAASADVGATDPVVLLGGARRSALILYTIAICASGIVYSSVPIHMLRIIENEGFTSQTAALVAMVMGPAQVFARIIDLVAGRKLDALITGYAALGSLLCALIILLFTSGWAASAIVFACLYGASQGLITIARGTVPLQLFGVHGYATLVGRITGLRFLINAGGPLMFSVLATSYGVSAAIMFNSVVAAIALFAFMLLPRPSPQQGI